MSQFRVQNATVVVPAGSWTDEFIAIPSGSTPPISASKLIHKFKAATSFGTAIGGAPANREEIVFVAQNSGNLRNVRAMLNVTGTAGNVTVDCLVNGASVLASPITVQNTDSDRQVIDAVINSPGLTAGDVVSLALVNVGNDGTGPFAWAEVDERE